MDLVYEASGDARFPLTFSVLNAARTRLINVTKGTNTIQDELVLDNPRKNNPFSFIGTDSAQILVRIDGTTLTDTAVFS